MNRADYEVGTLENKIEMDIGNAQSDLQKLTSSIDTLNTSLSKLLKNTGLKNISNQAKELSRMSFGDTLKSTFKVGLIAGGLKKGFNTIKDITSASIDMIETTNLFEVQMGKVVDEYGNLDEAQSQYYTKAMAFQDEMNEKLGTNKSEMQKYQAMYYGMLNAQLGSNNRKASYLMSESLTKAGYDIASLYNLDVETAMNKLKSGLAGQIESLRQIGIDVSEASLAKILDHVGIDRSVQQLSYAEKEVARYIAICQQAGKAQGDFARTFEQPANQIRVFKNQMIELKQVAGSFFVGLFGQIMPVINGIIMAIKEVLKALGSVFGFEVDMGNSSLGAVEDTVGDIDSGIGSATKKAKEFKKQLMGFDEINNITPPNENSGGSGGGTVTGVDSALLNALKEWDNQMDSISGKAQEIRDKILDWLGATDGSYENLKKIGEVVIEIGAGLLAWKVSNKFLEIIQKAGALQNLNAFQMSFGIGLSITGIWAMWNGTKRLLDGDVDIFSLLETFLGMGAGTFGIVNILRSLKNGAGENIFSLGQSFKIGLGFTLAIVGFSITMNGLDTNNMQKQLGGLLASAFGGYLIGNELGGWKIGLTIALVASISNITVSGIKEIEDVLDDEVKRQWEGLNEILERNNNLGIPDYVSNLQATRQAIQDNTDNLLAQVGYTENLVTELESLIDANGNVIKGYEGRVKIILTQLNNIYGTEYELTGNQITQNGKLVRSYNDIKDSIYKVIEAKKAEILLNANEEIYANALKNRIPLLKKYQQAEKDLADFLVTSSENRTNTESEAYKKKLQQLTDNLDLAKKEYEHTLDDIISYEELQTAIIEGNSEKIEQAISDITNTYEIEGEKVSANLKDRLIDSINYKNRAVDIFKQEGKEINEQTRIHLDAGIKTLAEKLVEQTSTIKNLTPDQIEMWKLLAENSETVYNEEISKVNEDTRFILDTINDKVDTSSPEFIQKWKSIAGSSHDDFVRILESLPEETKKILKNMANEIKDETPETGGAVNELASKFNIFKNIDLFETGKNIVEGLRNGITNSKSLLERAISSLSNSIPSSLKNLLKINSPSKVMIPIGGAIPEGLAKGIDSETFEVVKSAKDMALSATNAVANNINMNIGETSKGIKINTKDFKVDTNQYVNYSAIKGQIQAQSNVTMKDSIAGEIRKAVIEGMRNSRITVEVEGKADKDGIFKVVQKGAREYTMQTGEPAFGY